MIDKACRKLIAFYRRLYASPDSLPLPAEGKNILEKNDPSVNGIAGYAKQIGQPENIIFNDLILPISNNGKNNGLPVNLPSQKAAGGRHDSLPTSVFTTAQAEPNKTFFRYAIRFSTGLTKIICKIQWPATKRTRHFPVLLGNGFIYCVKLVKKAFLFYKF
jgi:hypothetical protein